ncbi:MAG: hypothetical protein NTW38_11820 [Candidatus Aminicenantes bacterium]|nr:hypothetical protein [Candidatus Aminicenantes bacterium]
MSQGLSLPGWISIVLGWGAILELSLYCIYRVLFGPTKAVMDVAA